MAHNKRIEPTPHSKTTFFHFGLLICRPVIRLNQMRDRRFIAQHRDGPLLIDDHRLLATWAADCSEHVLHLLHSYSDDTRPAKAIKTARAWSSGNATVGEARNASFECHAAARELSNISPVVVAVARSAGHAVATAHMADHCLNASRYALMAIANAGLDVDAERKWQLAQLPNSVRHLVTTTSDT